MAQSGYTPISLYYSSTATNIPSAGNLAAGELALNTADGIMYYKNASNAVVPLSGGSSFTWQAVQTSGFTAAANSGYPVNTTSGAVTVTLPASPTLGQQVGILDYAGTFATNNVTVNPNGGKIEGSTSNFTMNVNREALTFGYVDSVQGWVPFKSFLAPAPVTTYLIYNSLRFRYSNGAYLNRTSGTSTSQTTWTVSFWLKIGNVFNPAERYDIFTAGSTTTDDYFISLSQNNLTVFAPNSAATYALTTSQVFVDTAAWYHIVVAQDTTQATASNRVKIYVNGNQVTALSSAIYPAQNSIWGMNRNSTNHYIGRYAVFANNYLDGYLAEVNFIDGQALAPTAFGKVSPTLGTWIPIAYTGTYGTNGYYLKFTNKTSTATLGNDFSGNGNTWTVNNVSLTTGSTYDSMTDVPTLTDASTANYAVLNPLDYYGTITVSNGNLQGYVGAVDSYIKATIAIPLTGKYYWEVTGVAITGGGAAYYIGVMLTSTTTVVSAYQYTYAYLGTGNKQILNSQSAYGATYTTNDVIGVAYDADTGSLTFYKNNVSQGVATTGITAQCTPVVYDPTGGGTMTYNVNFGQQPFAYTPPTGYVALNYYNV